MQDKYPSPRSNNSSTKSTSHLQYVNVELAQIIKEKRDLNSHLIMHQPPMKISDNTQKTTINDESSTRQVEFGVAKKINYKKYLKRAQRISRKYRDLRLFDHQNED